MLQCRKMKKSLVLLAGILLISLLYFAVSAEAAVSWPSVSNKSYCEFVAEKNINVYRDTACKTRGTSSPAKSYNAYISRNDVCYIYKITNSYLQVNYPTSGGRKTGYIKRADFVVSSGISAPTKLSKSTGKVTTYKYPGSASYGNTAAGDAVYALGAKSGYTAVIYTAKSGNRAFKYGFVKTADYNKITMPAATTVSATGNKTFDPIWPCAKTYTVTCLYKYSSGAKHSSRFATGIDIGAPSGENVLAIEDGTVITSEYSKSSGFGNWIMIKHNNGKVSLYAHLSKRNVSVGTVVKRGTVIGNVGNSSAKYVIGAHLHFELGNTDKAGAAGDPWKDYFKSKYGSKIKLVQAAAKYH